MHAFHKDLLYHILLRLYKRFSPLPCGMGIRNPARSRIPLIFFYHIIPLHFVQRLFEEKLV